jgi:hypothetical protein
MRGGVPVEQEFWVLMGSRDGKVTRSAVYTDRDQALEAAGLSEKAMSPTSAADAVRPLTRG